MASDQLPLEDVETVRSLVRSCISDAVARDAKTWNALPDDIIGSLEDLHAPLKQHRDELEQLSKLVNALPENGETLSVTVSLVRKDVPPTEYYGVDRVWPKLGVAQTDGESKIQVFSTQPKVYLLTLDHPGGEIHFSLYRERAATDPDPGVSFSKLGADGAMLSGPWSVLNMIRYADVAKPVSDTDDSWTVEFTVKPVSGEADYWLLLELVFDKPLPEDALRGWPSLKDE